MCNWDKSKTFYHEWIGLGKKKNNKRLQLLSEVYKNKKQDELELLEEIMTDDEIKELARELHWNEKEIKNL
jgi:hypothetical protein